MATQSITWRERRDMSWAEFNALVDAETDRWIAKFKQSGYMTRNREQTRANIVRGLMLGTYQLPTAKPEKSADVTPDQRRQRAMWRKWNATSREHRRVGAA